MREVHALKQVQVYADRLLVQGFIVYSGLADPVLGFLFEKHLKEISQNLSADDLLYEFVVVLLAF